MLKVFVDRGGTFTDIVILTDHQKIIDNTSTQDKRFCAFKISSKKLIILYKILSENPRKYQDAVIQGIRDIMGVKTNKLLDTKQLEIITIGTPVATNAFLERKGADKF